MTGPPVLSGSDLQMRREVIRKELVRTTTAGALILLIVIFLAVLALYAALRANWNADEAHRSSQLAQDRLWNAYLAQARSARLSGQAGRRSQSLAAVKAAAAIRPSPELCTEAIAALALSDLDQEGSSWPVPETVSKIAFDADLNRYAFAYRNGDLSVMRTKDHSEERRWRLTNDVADALLFSSDGRLLAARGRTGIRIWNLGSGDLTAWIAPDRTISPEVLEFSIDAKRLLIGQSDGSVSFRDATTGKELQCTSVIMAPLGLIRLQPQRRLLAAANEGALVLWDIAQNREVRRFTHSIPITSIDWSADGSLIAVSNDDTQVYVYDIDSGQRHELRGHTREVVNAVFGGPDPVLATFSWDGTCRVWDAGAGVELVRSHLGQLHAFSRDGKRLALRQGQNLVLAALTLPAEFRRCRYPIGRGQWFHKQMVFTTDSRFMFAGDNDGVVAWDVASGRVVDQTTHGEAQALHLTPDQQAIYTSGWAGVFRIPLLRQSKDAELAIRFGTMEPIALTQTGRVHSSAMSLDGTRLGVRVQDKLLVLEMPASKPKASLPAYGPVYPGLSVDGRFVAVGKGVWDLLAERAAFELSPQELTRTSVRSAFSPDGAWCVITTSSEYVFREMGTWHEARRLRRNVPSGVPGPIAFTPDSQFAAIELEPGSAQFLDFKKDQLLASFTNPDQLAATHLGLSADGRYLAVATDMPAIQIWDTQRIRERLSELGLTWGTNGPQKPVLALNQAASVWMWNRTPVMLAVLAGVVGLVLVLGAVVLRHHQHLMQEYLRTDALAEERNQQLERAQTEIYHSQKMKALGTLAAGIAHDFNNLLSIIRMANKLTAREAKENPEVQENVALVEKAVAQGKDVVNSMLGYSREPIEPQGPFSVTEMVESAVALLSKQFLGGIDLKLELDRAAPKANCSKGRLEQILLNLVVNASEAMAGRGRMIIAVRRSAHPPSPCVLRPILASQYVELSVADSGPGIRPEILPRIFEPFFSTKAAGTARGTGLGLSMVYSLARQDGIGINVETELEKGATFRITIPAA